MVYKFFEKKFSGSGVNTHANKERPLCLATHQVAEESHKPVIKKFKKEHFILDSKAIFGVLI